MFNLAIQRSAIFCIASTEHSASRLDCQTCHRLPVFEELGVEELQKDKITTRCCETVEVPGATTRWIRNNLRVEAVVVAVAAAAAAAAAAK